MTVKQSNPILAPWEFTPMGSFRNKVTNRMLSRRDWEVEMAYELAHDPEALAEAKAMAARAAKMMP